MIRTSVTVLAALLLSPVAGRAAIEMDGAAIHFHADAERALLLGAAQEKVTVVYFTARWCGWCRKMSSETFTDPRVTALADQFVWTRIDVDADPATAAAFGVEGVPQIAMVSARGFLIASQPGYMTPEKLEQALQHALERVDDAGVLSERQRQIDDLLAGSDRDAASLARALVEALATPERGGRAALLQALRELEYEAVAQAVKLLSAERLAVRAAAADVLNEFTDAGLPFDPFADADQRDRQAAAWSVWLQGRGSVIGD